MRVRHENKLFHIFYEYYSFIPWKKKMLCTKIKLSNAQLRTRLCRKEIIGFAPNFFDFQQQTNLMHRCDPVHKMKIILQQNFNNYQAKLQQVDRNDAIIYQDISVFKILIPNENQMKLELHSSKNCFQTTLIYFFPACVLRSLVQ